MILTKKKLVNYFPILTSLKCSKSAFLNILGLQPLRYLLAKFIRFINYMINKNKYNFLPNSFFRDGFFIRENFLTTNQFIDLKKEFEQLIDTKSKDVWKDVDHNINSSIKMLTYDFKINKDERDKYPNLIKLYYNEDINNYFKSAENKKNILLYMRVDRVITLNEKQIDYNGTWHVDTFHDTHKAFFYLSDVSVENGPYNLVKGSQKFSFFRIFWEYKNSIKYSIGKSLIHFILNSRESENSEKKKIDFPFKKNTFFMSNTHGFHRRGPAKTGSIRDNITFYTRENPFKINI